MKIKACLELMRFHFHASFITVVLGALLFTPHITTQLIYSILLCYITFNVFIYGGLYTFNDIIDAKEDSRHPIKKHRPIPSGRISVRSAAIFSILLIAGGLVAGSFLISDEVYRLYFIFIFLNIIYTLAFKKIIYLNLAIIASTHTLRFVMGATLAQHSFIFTDIAAFYLLLFNVAVTIHSMFNLKPYETPFYTRKAVACIQALCLALPLLLLTYTKYTLNLPIAAFWSGALLLSLLSYFKYFRPFIAKIFMIKLSLKN